MRLQVQVYDKYRSYKNYSINAVDAIQVILQDKGFTNSKLDHVKAAVTYYWGKRMDTRRKNVEYKFFDKFVKAFPKYIPGKEHEDSGDEA